MAKGHATFRLLREMEDADRLSAPALDALRNARLREFLAYCYTHVPFVRERMQHCGLDPRQTFGPADLVRLPPMTKDDIRRRRAELRSDTAGRLVSYTTGGSTGEPLIFDLSRRRIAARVACRQRVSRWWGLSVGDPEIALWGSPVELTRQHRLQAARDWLLSTTLLPAFEMNDAMMSRYLDILERRPCRQIFGYPSAIYLLCLHARKQGRDLRRTGVRVVFTTGEVLFPHQRELISEAFGAPVADGYGGRDSGFIAHECPQGGMHILGDCMVVEILDQNGNPVAPGESGEITVTDLHSHEAPFIRYRTGDIGAVSTRRCGCGRALPLLERIEGRSNDAILAPDGRIMNSLALIYAVREVPGIEQFRIRQLQPDRFQVQIVRTGEFPPDGEGRILQGWTRLMRSTISVSFEFPMVMPIERSGKFRHVVSDIPAARELRRADSCQAVR